MPEGGGKGKLIASTALHFTRLALLRGWYIQYRHMPFPTRYVVDLANKVKKEDLEASLLPGNHGRPGGSRLLCRYHGGVPLVLTLSSVGIRSPVSGGS